MANENELLQLLSQYKTPGTSIVPYETPGVSEPNIVDATENSKTGMLDKLKDMFSKLSPAITKAAPYATALAASAPNEMANADYNQNAINAAILKAGPVAPELLQPPQNIVNQGQRKVVPAPAAPTAPQQVVDVKQAPVVAPAPGIPDNSSFLMKKYMEFINKPIAEAKPLNIDLSQATAPAFGQEALAKAQEQSNQLGLIEGGGNALSNIIGAMNLQKAGPGITIDKEAPIRNLLTQQANEKNDPNSQMSVAMRQMLKKFNVNVPPGITASAIEQIFPQITKAYDSEQSRIQKEEANRITSLGHAATLEESQREQRRRFAETQGIKKSTIDASAKKTIVQDFNKSTKDYQSALEGAEKLIGLLDSKIPIGDQTIRSLAARSLAGEKGVLTDKDVTRLSGDPSIGARYKEFLSNVMTGKMSDDNRKQFLQLAKMTKDQGANRFLAKKNELVSQYSQVYSKDPKEVAELIDKDGEFESGLLGKAAAKPGITKVMLNGVQGNVPVEKLADFLKKHPEAKEVK